MKDILQDPIVRAITIPIIFALAAALFESTAALVKGRSKGDYKFRIWVRQDDGNGHSTIAAVQGQSISSILRHTDIVDIDSMVSFDLADFATLGIDLVVGAFAIDVASLLSSDVSPTSIGLALVMHVFALIGIIMFVMLTQLANPTEVKTKRIRASVAIGLGLIAMMISFLAL